MFIGGVNGFNEPGFTTTTTTADQSAAVGITYFHQVAPELNC